VQIGCAAHFVPCGENDAILTEWQGVSANRPFTFIFWQVPGGYWLKINIKHSIDKRSQFF
jgi:hypothetical protein